MSVVVNNNAIVFAGDAIRADDSAAAGGRPYDTRADAASSVRRPNVQYMSYVDEDGQVLHFYYDPSAPTGGVALTMSDGSKWSPNGPVYPDHFGRNQVPGTTDVSANFQGAAVYLAARGGGEIVCALPRGPYALDTVDITGGVSIVGDATLVVIGASANLIEAKGTAGADISLTANAVAGGNTVTIASTASFAENDYFFITDNVSYTSTDAGYKNGEMLRVKEVTSGTVLTVYGTILGGMGGSDYTTANSAKINRVALAKQSRVEGITIQGDWDSFKRLIYMEYVSRPIVQNVEISGHGNQAIFMRGTVGDLITGNIVARLRNDIPGGHAGYGITHAGPCLGGVVSNNTTLYCRHGYTTMGGGTGFPRDILVTGNTDLYSSVSSFDSHAAMSDSVFSDNTSLSSLAQGVTIRGMRLQITNNNVIECAGIGIQGSEENLSSLLIANNTVTDPGSLGIQVSTKCDDLQIINNTLTRCGNRGIRVFNAATTQSLRLIVTGNLIDGVSLVGANEGIVTGGTFNNTAGVISGNTVRAGAGTPNYAIRPVNLTASDVCDNFASGTFSALAFDPGTGNVSENNRIAQNSGGAVTQLTSKSTGVTLTKSGSVITTNAAALAAGASVDFVVTDPLVTISDIPGVVVRSPANKYIASVVGVAVGSYTVRLKNDTAGSLSEAVLINVGVLKGAIA